MQKLRRTGAYAGWCIAIGLVGVIVITQVHDIGAQNQMEDEQDLGPAGVERVAMESIISRFAERAPTACERDVGGANLARVAARLQTKWNEYQDALHAAQTREALQGMLHEKEDAEAQVRRIQEDIDQLCPGGLAASTNECIQE